jgi:squalene-associated FAD-dependent desaturase
MTLNSSFDIIILGAGISGMSAAMHCIKQGKRPLLIEATANFGGRARSFEDRVSGDIIDNGQHVMMGCYASFFELIEEIGMMHKIQKQKYLTIPFHFTNGEKDLLIAKGFANIHGPIGMALGMLRLKFLNIRDKRSMLLFALRLKLGICKPGSMTAKEFLLSEEQSDRLIDLIWTPVILATMNGNPEEVSAKIFVTVLRLAFFGSGDASSLYIPQCGLSELFEPFESWMNEHGGKMLRSIGVQSIDIENNQVIGVTLQDGRRVESSNVVSAIPPHALQKIIPNALHQHSYFSMLEQIRYSPIVSLYLWFDTSFPEIDLSAVMNAKTQWIFKKSTTMKSAKSLLALTISAGDDMVGYSTEEIANLCANEVRQCFPEMQDAQLIHWKVIKEKSATVLIDPDTEIQRPNPKSPVDGLIIAGDWTNTGLPATLEGAALSGKIAASLI